MKLSEEWNLRKLESESDEYATTYKLVAVEASAVFSNFGTLTLPRAEQSQRQQARARLIEAAPELLEALRHIENLLEVQQGPRNDIITGMIWYCKKVIAKIEGRE